MNRTRIAGLIFMVAATSTLFAGGSSEVTVETEIPAPGTPVSLEIVAGEHYLHRMRILPLITVKNPPQMAIWTETADGEFLETLLVTNRIGRQEWRKAPGDSTPAEEIRRQEALPVWSYARGRANENGMLLPTRDDPAPDAVTVATPDVDFEVKTSYPNRQGDVIVYLEVNASTDFNDTYPKDAVVGSPGYSGGVWGSGQPSLVYRGIAHPADPHAGTELKLVGHGSADGSDGAIYPELDGITTARSILESVRLSRSDVK